MIRLASVLFLAALPIFSQAENWPMWRGPRLDGTSLDKGFPTTLDGKASWKTVMPGAGHASPIVWEDRIYTVANLKETSERVLLCLDRETGTILWQSTVLKSPMEGKHDLNSYASSTPATDGKVIYTAFLDQKEMVVSAHDASGKLVWQKRPGTFASKHGFCSSPILFKDKVIVNGDHDGDGYIVALSRADGKELWRITRPNKTRSYSVPLIRELAGKTQMVLSGTKCVASYDPNTGGPLWIIQGPTEQFVASMVYNDRAGLLFMTGGFPQHHLLAIRPDGTGDVTETHIKWRTNKGAAYVPSPISEGDYFLVVSDSGITHCFEAANGNLAWVERMGATHASMAAAEGNVYIFNDKGTLKTLKPGPAYAEVATSEFGETIFATPAFSEGQIFIRGDKTLTCFGKRVK